MNGPLPRVLSDLHPDPQNPRRIDERARIGLSASMERFGDLSGIVFNVRTGELATGHQRKGVLPLDAPLEEFREASDDVGTVGYGYVIAQGRRWHVRFVDWDRETQAAANVAANNRHITGEFTPELRDILKGLETAMPDVYDQTMMAPLLEDLGRQRRQEAEGEGPAPEYDLSPMPYEHYSYVVLLFRNEIDWATAQDHFKLKKVRDPKNTKRVGLGCVIDGAMYLNEQLGHLWTRDSKLSSPPATGPSSSGER